MKPLRVCSIINGTAGGAGAERMLQRVIRHANTPEFEHLVISIKNFRTVAEELTAEGINVQTLGVYTKYHRLPMSVLQMAAQIRAFKPDVVQTWMYMSDLFGGLAAQLAAPKTPVIWTIRHSTLDPDIDSRGLRWSATACAKLSRRVPTRILLNSHAAIPNHVAAGYDESRMQVIPNGFDIDRFKPDENARCETRKRLGILQDAPLVGRVARFHPHKDHESFLKAARIVHEQRPDVRFLMCGEPLHFTTEHIRADIAGAGLTDVVQLVELQSDIVPLNCSFDIATCSSITEAFPNVVGEAMACGVPCVSTDVGDASHIVGDTGRVVPSACPEKFAKELLELLSLSEFERRQLGCAARQRVIDRFELTASTEQFVQTWRDLAGRSADTDRKSRAA